MPIDLYFLPIIAEALAQRHPRAALTVAFSGIERLSGRPDYQRGFRQFLQFMHAVVRARMRLDRNGVEVRDLITQIAGDVPDPDSAELRGRIASEYAEFIIERAGRSVGHIRLETQRSSGSVSRIEPGTYSVTLSTGWGIWEAALTERDLIWSAAFPGRALDAAADTGNVGAAATREIPLLDGELTLRVFPGIDSGRIEIEANAGGANDDLL